MSREGVSDADLVRAFQRGDSDAFDAFVRRHQDRVYRLAAVQLHTSNLAEDASQEVFMRALTGLKAFRFGATPATWLFRTTANVCKEINRRSGTATEAQIKRASIPMAATTDLAEQEQSFAMVRALVKDLPPRQRDVVMLRVFEDLSVKETAAIMRCREGTVKALLHKAMAGLRKRMEQQARLA